MSDSYHVLHTIQVPYITTLDSFWFCFSPLFPHRLEKKLRYAESGKNPISFERCVEIESSAINLLQYTISTERRGSYLSDISLCV